MATVNDFPAVGRILSAGDDFVLFQPANTTYEWKLLTPGKYDGPVNQRIEGIIRVRARKLYTVPSGGNFVQPIFGPPRIVQGRLRFADDQHLVLHAGAPIVVQLPAEDAAYDFSEGPLAIGNMVNVVALPGASFELVTQSVAG